MSARERVRLLSQMSREFSAPIISLEEAGRRFEEWRHNRSGKGRIPAKRSVAVEVAGKEGLNRTARELHVAWDDLKRRVATSGEVPQ